MTSRLPEELPTFNLGVPGPMRERLVEAVLRGDKRATSSLHVFYEMEREPLPRPGARFALTGGGHTVEIERVQVIPLGEVGDDVAHAEGEGFEDAAGWRKAHEAFWARYTDEVRSYLGDPAWAVTDETLVVVEHFRLIGEGR